MKEQKMITFTLEQCQEIGRMFERANEALLNINLPQMTVHGERSRKETEVDTALIDASTNRRLVIARLGIDKDNIVKAIEDGRFLYGNINIPAIETGTQDVVDHIEEYYIDILNECIGRLGQPIPREGWWGEYLFGNKKAKERAQEVRDEEIARANTLLEKYRMIQDKYKESIDA